MMQRTSSMRSLMTSTLIILWSLTPCKGLRLSSNFRQSNLTSWDNKRDENTNLNNVTTVSYGTLFTMGNDVLPIDQMLRHQLTGSSIHGRARFDKVLVYLNGLPHPPKVVPREFTDVLPTFSGEVRLVDEERLSDNAFFNRFFQDPQASALKDMGFDMGGRRANALFTFLEDCRSTYCVWMDPDIFVHRSPDGPGWVDFAVAIMDKELSKSVVTRPRLGSRGLKCMKETSPGISDRYFVVHRERFLKEFPISTHCAPRCDTWESEVSQSLKEKPIMSSTQCNSFWAVHPPDNKNLLLEIIRSCAAEGSSSGKEAIEAGLKVILQHIEDHGTGHLSWDPDFKLENNGENLANTREWPCKRRIASFMLSTDEAAMT